MEKLVSIIMPAYNCEQYVGEAIQSLFNQTYTHWELLVADDCSTDHTKTILDTFEDERIKRYDNSCNRGYLKTCNKLFAKCKGDYITFQDADDYSIENRLETLVYELNEDQDLMMVGSNIYTLNDSLVPKRYPAEDVEINKLMLDRFPFCGASIMIRHEIYVEYGGYDELFDRIGSEDYYWAGVIAARCKSKNVQDFLYVYRDNLSSVSKNISKPENLISGELAKQLLKMIMAGVVVSDRVDMEAMKQDLLKPFLRDPSLLYRKNCDLKAYYGDKVGMRYNARQALKAAPFKWINWKYFLSTLLR